MRAEMETSNVGAASASRQSVESASGGLCACIPCRVIFIFMGFFCFFNLYAMRVDLSIAIVSMINVTHMKQLEAEELGNNTIPIDSVICDDDRDPAPPERDGSFNWDSKQQSYILSNFFYGYLVTQLPGGILAEKYGGKVVLLGGIAWTSLLTLLTPIVTQAGGFAAILTIRFLEGIAGGFVYPAMHVMLANWTPVSERGRMITFVYSGAPIGAVVSLLVSGVLCHQVSWQSVFYVFGSVGLLWCLMWIFLIYDKPSVHPRITSVERNHIQTMQGPQRNRADIKTPWLKIATSPAVFALVMANFAFNWGNFFLLTVIPQFVSHVLKYNIQNSGIVAASPFLAMFLGMLLAGVVADLLLSRHLASVTGVRRLFIILGFLVPASCQIGIGFVECEKEVAVFLLAVAGFCLGLSWSGWGVNHLDLAPLFAGTLFGISNGFAATPGSLTPLIVGALTYRDNTRGAWRISFYISAGGLLLGAVVFLIFGSGKRQKWSNPEPKPSVTAPKAPAPRKSTKRSSAAPNRTSAAKKSLSTAV